MCTVAAVWQGLTGVVRMQTAAEMFVMVLDVHKWVPLPAIAARAKQSSSAAVPAGMPACAPIHPSVLQPILQIHSRRWRSREGLYSLAILRAAAPVIAQ